MFDFGFWELLIIGVIALLVVGPERLPSLMRTAGLWVGRARAAMTSIREEVEREVDAEGLRDTRRALEKNVREAVDESGKPFKEAAEGARDTLNEARREAEADAGSANKDNQTSAAESDAPRDTSPPQDADGAGPSDEPASSSRGAGNVARERR